MHSCIYEGIVTHFRVSPSHCFRQHLFLMYLDLEELDTVFSGRVFWSTGRPNLAWFRRADHVGAPEQGLSDCIRQLVEVKTGFCPSGRIGLLTQLRWFGHLQNPVSFYYCWDSSDSRVEAVVAEVTNTPWRERHCYVIDLRRRSDECGNRRPVTQKELHVSPFLPMDLSYQWRFRQPGQSLSVHVSDLHGQSCVFKASLVLRRRRITTGNLAQIFVKYPFITARVTSGIYWHALRLWWKKAVFHTHPARAV